MSREWCYAKSWLSKQNCEHIVREVLQQGLSNASLGVHGHSDDSVRRSRTAFLYSSDPRFQWIFDIFWQTAIIANRDFFDIQISKLDFVQFTEYNAEVKGEYKEHHDVFWVNDDPKYHRKLSAVIQLSDPDSYQGGDLEITEASIPLDKDARSQGTVIYFPSLLRHRILPVTQGTRYSLVAWFDGPKWR